jgi:hypothetical protein
MTMNATIAATTHGHFSRSAFVGGNGGGCPGNCGYCGCHGC